VPAAAQLREHRRPVAEAGGLGEAAGEHNPRPILRGIAVARVLPVRHRGDLVAAEEQAGGPEVAVHQPARRVLDGGQQTGGPRVQRRREPWIVLGHQRDRVAPARGERLALVAIDDRAVERAGRGAPHRMDPPERAPRSAHARERELGLGDASALAPLEPHRRRLRDRPRR
jgi:hypothetical protein